MWTGKNMDSIIIYIEKDIEWDEVIYVACKCSKWRCGAIQKAFQEVFGASSN
jgi:hypothetical protein